MVGHASLTKPGLGVWWVMGQKKVVVSKLDLLDLNGVISWALMSPDGRGQVGNEEVKLVPHSSPEKSQKHESVLTYLQRIGHTLWSLYRNKPVKALILKLKQGTVQVN